MARLMPVFILGLLALFLMSATSSASEPRVVLASEIMGKIQRGEDVEYHDALIKGDLDIGDLNLPTENVSLPTLQPIEIIKDFDSEGIHVAFLVKPDDISGLSEEKKVIASEIFFVDCIFGGAVNLENAFFKNEVWLSNNRFTRAADLRGAFFSKELNLFNSSFMSSASFYCSIFENESSFNKCKFYDIAGFRGSRFIGFASFQDCDFNGSADFIQSKFEYIPLGPAVFFPKDNFSADFLFSDFEGNAFFAGSQFQKGACFILSKFRRMAEFNSSLLNEVDYSQAQLNKAFFEGSKFSNAKFENTTFKNHAFFEGAQFNNSAIFNKVKFNSSSDFSSSRFRGPVFIDSANLRGETLYRDAMFLGGISFNESQFSSDAFFEGAYFAENSSLRLYRSQFQKLYLRYRNITGRLAYDDEAYLFLMENYKKLGWLEDADACYYDYRRARHSQSFSDIGLFDIERKLASSIDWLMDITYGYGVKPERPLYGSIAIVLLFTLFWWSVRQIPAKTLDWEKPRLDERRAPTLKDFWRSVRQVPAKILDWKKLRLDERIGPTLKDFWRSLYDLDNSLEFSLTLFLSGTKLLVDPPKCPQLPGKKGALVRHIFTLQRVLGMLFFFLFILAVSRTVIRGT